LSRIISVIFVEGFKYFYWNRIASSGNYNYSIIGGEVQEGGYSYCVKKEKEKEGEI
jgi:hypothetical protein